MTRSQREAGDHPGVSAASVPRRTGSCGVADQGSPAARRPEPVLATTVIFDTGGLALQGGSAVRAARSGPAASTEAAHGRQALRGPQTARTNDGDFGLNVEEFQKNSATWAQRSLSELGSSLRVWPQGCEPTPASLTLDNAVADSPAPRETTQAVALWRCVLRDAGPDTQLVMRLGITRARVFLF